jgi:hypothetical protein
MGNGDELLKLLESQAASATKRSRELAYMANMSGTDKHKWQRESEEWSKVAKKWEEAITLRRKETEGKP